MPLSFDMPFEELPHYQGTNPRPDDFDEFWDRSLAEMRALDPEVELVQADFQTAVRGLLSSLFHGRRRRTRTRQADPTRRTRRNRIRRS